MKNTRFYSLAVTWFSTALLWSEPTKIEFEKLLSYESVRVTKVTPAGITIMHKSGVAKIPYAEIPEDIRKQLGLNAEDAKAFTQKEKMRQAQAAKKVQQQKLLKESKMVLHGEIAEITKTGILLRDAYSTNGEMIKVRPNYRSLPTGSLGRVGGASGRKSPSPVERLKKTYYEAGFVHVECDNEKFVDGQEWKGTVYPAKRFHHAIDGIRTGKVMQGFQTSSLKFLEWKEND